MKIPFIFTLLLLFTTYNNSVFGQQLTQPLSSENRVFKIRVTDKLFKRELSEFTFTALLIRADQSIKIEKYKVIINGDTLHFSNDVHAPSNVVQSNLLQFSIPQSNFELISPDTDAELELILINGSFNKEDEGKTGSKSGSQDPCEPLLNIIEQGSWRAGLAAPSFNRSFTIVENIIVHHSAGLNSVTDYRQAVRDIYILHTQVNGWSDIGYNYLIAPDGAVFAGRDPLDGAQDNVIGAHFCGSNSGTMGICLLGNYELVNPADTMVSSLERLMSWKINKEEQLAAIGSNPHPLNSNLNYIAGHRDGCSTACPGQNVYARLASIRLEVAEGITNCNDTEPTPSDPDPSGPEIIGLDINQEQSAFEQYTIYPNPLKDRLYFYVYLADVEPLNEINLIDQSGKELAVESNVVGKNLRIQLMNNVERGIYYLHFRTEGGLLIRKLLIL